METITIEKPETETIKETASDSVAVIVLLVNNPAFKVEKPYAIKLLGKAMSDWVIMAAEGHNPKTVEYNMDEDILLSIRPHLTDAKYTVVLFSDAPLLKAKTLSEIIDYARLKKVGVVKLTRGYVFETEFVKSAETLYSAQPHYFDEEDFMTAYNYKQLTFIESILKTRILSFHMKRGVRILEPDSTMIDAEVTIEEGTVIHGGNRLYDTCYIGKNVKLLPNNYIKNSIIDDNSKVLYSVIENSKIPPNSNIGPFEKIIH
ncbi:MAG: hypothetical protein LBN07_04980 [Christensenellaceae bacterium]|jgi:bifunctional N-acetylglucosamine-1-phosphate-uridyltransferase/glucosamine-1-phosphate-acetyltransferase GlmU-like protein|nr:hypothetical protein [Christensenellaceae bacterium]